MPIGCGVCYECLKRKSNQWKVRLYEDVTFPHSNIYSIQQVIPDFRPWGIRKSGVLKSLNKDSGFLKIRKSNSWKDIQKYSYDKVGKENQGTSRIRKNGKWLGQGKIGN